MRVSPNNKMLEVNGKVFDAKFVKVKKELIKTNFETSGYQFRENKQIGVIEKIKNDFRGYLIFDNNSVNGLPVIDKNYNVIIGNHRAQAMLEMSEEQFAKVQADYEDYFEDKLEFDLMPVRMLKGEIDIKEVIEIAKVSNLNRETTFGEKAINNGAKYYDAIRNLPTLIQAANIDEVESIVARRLDPSGHGLNVYEANLALLTFIIGSDRDTLDYFNNIKQKGLSNANKTRDLLISNAGTIWNLINDTRLAHLNLRDILAKAIKSLTSTHSKRLVSDNVLLQDIQDFLALAPEMKKMLIETQPDYINEYSYAVIGNGISKFLEQENPKGSFFSFLSTLADKMVEDYSANLLDPDADVKNTTIYEFVNYFINNGRNSFVQNELGAAFQKLKELSFEFKTEIKEKVFETELPAPTDEIKEIEVESLISANETSEDFYSKAFELLPTKKKLHYYADTKLGWIQVPLKDLHDLGVLNHLGRDSFYQGKFAYLEKEIDMEIYLNIMRARGFKIEIVEHIGTRKSVVWNMKRFENLITKNDRIDYKNRMLEIAQKRIDIAIEKGMIIYDGNAFELIVNSKSLANFDFVA